MKKVIILIISFYFFSNIVTVKANSLANDAKSACLIELNSKMIIYEKEKDIRLTPASMTKIMTLTLIMEAIQNNIIKKDDILTTSEKASSMGGSQVFLEEGERHTLNDLLKCICIASANDASVTVAEAIYGSEQAFVQKMNEKVKQLGLSNTNFVDCTGLSFDNHYSSSYDMAIIGANLILNYPDVLEYTKIGQDYFRQNTKNPFWLVNTNKLVRFVDGVDGLKTGWTNEAGYCLTATKMQNGMRLVGVIMGCESPTIRNSQMVEMLNYGFSNYKSQLFLEKNQIIKTIKDIRYRPNIINIVINEDKLIILPKNNNKELTYKYQIDYDRLYNGEKYVGECDIFLDDVLIGKEKLSTMRKIEKENFLKISVNILWEIIKI